MLRQGLLYHRLVSLQLVPHKVHYKHYHEYTNELSFVFLLHTKRNKHSMLRNLTIWTVLLVRHKFVFR